MSMGAVGIVGAAQVYYDWKTQKLRGSLGPSEATNPGVVGRLRPCAAGLARGKKPRGVRRPPAGLSMLRSTYV